MAEATDFTLHAFASEAWNLADGLLSCPTDLGDYKTMSEPVGGCLRAPPATNNDA